MVWYSSVQLVQLHQHIGFRTVKFAITDPDSWSFERSTQERSSHTTSPFAFMALLKTLAYINPDGLLDKYDRNTPRIHPLG